MKSYLKEKFILTFVCSTLAVVGCAQQRRADFKMSVAEYQKAILIRDLIKTMPADCKVLQYEASVVVKGHLSSLSTISDSIKWNRDKAAPGNKIFIAIRASTCKMNKKKEYKIVLE